MDPNQQARNLPIEMSILDRKLLLRGVSVISWIGSRQSGSLGSRVDSKLIAWGVYHMLIAFECVSPFYHSELQYASGCGINPWTFTLRRFTT